MKASNEIAELLKDSDWLASVHNKVASTTSESISAAAIAIVVRETLAALQAEPVGKVIGQWKGEMTGKQYAIIDAELSLETHVYTTPQPAKVPEGIDAELIAAILEDYADLQTTGMIMGASRYRPSDAIEQAELLAAPAAGEGEWKTMETAPKDGTVIQLLIHKDELPDCIDGEEAGDLSRTIGLNGFDNDTVDCWRVVGWSWAHDCFTDSVGDGRISPVGWLPLAPLPTPPSEDKPR